MSEKGDKTLGVSHEVIDLTSDAEDDQIVDEAETGLAATQRLALQLATTTKREIISPMAGSISSAKGRRHPFLPAEAEAELLWDTSSTSHISTYQPRRPFFTGAKKPSINPWPTCSETHSSRENTVLTAISPPVITSVRSLSTPDYLSAPLFIDESAPSTNGNDPSEGVGNLFDKFSQSGKESGKDSETPQSSRNNPLLPPGTLQNVSVAPVERRLDSVSFAEINDFFDEERQQADLMDYERTATPPAHAQKRKQSSVSTDRNNNGNKRSQPVDLAFPEITPKKKKSLLKVKFDLKKNKGQQQKKKQKKSSDTIVDIEDSDVEILDSEPSTSTGVRSKLPLTSMQPKKKTAAKVVSERFGGNKRLEGLVEVDPMARLRMTVENVKKRNPPKAPPPIVNVMSKKPIGGRTAQNDVLANPARKSSESAAVADETATSLSGASFCAPGTSAGFNAKIVRPSFTPLISPPKRNPTLANIKKKYLTKDFVRDPVVFNANKSRTSLTSQYTANRNRLAHADRLSQAYVQQNIKESQRTFKKIPPRRKSAETEQGQEKIRRASNAYGGEDEHDSFASRHDLSDQLSQMTLDQEREAVDEPPAKRSKPNNDSSNTSGTSRSVAGRFDIDSLVAPKGPSTCFSKDVQVGPIATREVPMDIDRPSTSALQPKYVPTACSTPVEPAKVPPMIYPLSGPVIKPSQPKTYLPALDNFERKRSKYPTLRVKPKVTAKLAKDQSGSVAHFEDMLITWRPEWIQKYLTEQQSNGNTKPPCCFPKPDFDSLQCLRTYKEFREYDILHMGLKTYEVFEDLCKAKWEVSKMVLVNSVRLLDDISKKAVVEMKAIFKRSDNMLSDHWFCLIELDKSEFLGVTSCVSKREVMKVDDIAIELRSAFKDEISHNLGAGMLTVVSWVVAIRSTRNHPVTPSSGGFKVPFTPILNLVPAEREVSALGCLRNHPLKRVILEPKGKLEYFELDQITPTLSTASDQAHLNPSQLDVINSVTADVFLRDRPKIGLIHGPPGTGKSHVIVSILEEIQQRKQNANLANKLVLVTAPSNAAVESLVTKLDARKRMKASLNEAYLKFVCVGNNFAHDKLAFRYSVDEMVRKGKSIRSPKSNGELNFPSSVAHELKEINEEIDRHEKALSTLQSKNMNGMMDAGQKRDFLDTLINLKERRQRILASQKTQSTRTSTPTGNSQDHNPKQHMASCIKLVRNADVILCTLNSSGLAWLDDLLSEKDENGEELILAVIIDEVCQAVELETLIPLRWGTKKIYLVGDPKQLEPTVQSPVSKEKNYRQSMFHRFYDSFVSPLSKNPVKMLNTQYRMVPEIVKFPNEHFYRGQLLTDSSVTCPPELSALVPYAFVNVSYGREENMNLGFVNQAEVKVVIELIKHLKEIKKDAEIGVITFYREQVKKFSDALRANGLTSKGVDSGVEVNTVDSYQGREKSIIILSCVRGPKDKNSVRGTNIGFLDDSKRLNVALTRAKHILYVVGHSATLHHFQSRDKATRPDGRDHWRDLISDANERQLVFEVAKESEIRKLESFLKKKPA